MLLDRKRGRQPRSCNQCSRVKVHCKSGGEGPCERCTSRRWECTFNRHQADFDAADVPTAPLTRCYETGDRRGGRIPLSFLLNVTDDHQDYLTEEAIWKEPDAVPLGPACLPLLGTDEVSSEVLEFLDPSVLLLFDHESYITPSALDEPSPGCEERDPGSLTFTTSWGTKVSARLDQLEAELTRHAGSSNDRSLSFDSQCYRSFFSVTNVHHFITSFCRKRHYRYPIIHWPTFEAESAPLALLLVVSLTGAAYSLAQSSGVAHAVEARRFYKLADAYVFHELESHLYCQPTETSPTRSIELCQAALLMYALDTLLTSDLNMQYTAVAIRLPMLVSALRKLGSINARHELSEDWQTFIRREQMIRITAWTFCADCLATLTCNKPPGFSIMEMRGDLPCEAKIWESDIASFPEPQSEPKHSLTFNLRDLMAHWLNNDWPVPINTIAFPVFYLHIMLCGTSLLHLLNPPPSTTRPKLTSISTTAFQQVVFNSHVSLSLSQQSPALLGALATWRQLWNSTISKLADADRKSLGVAQHVSDLEHLMRTTIEVAIGPEAQTSKYLQRIPSVGTGEIHEFMRNFGEKI